MRYTEYEDPDVFLAATARGLEDAEAINGLMLGLALRLREDPLRYGGRPLLATVGDGEDLDLMVLMTPPRNLQIVSPGGYRERATQILAAELHQRDWPVPGVMAERQVAQAFADHWGRIAGPRPRIGQQQRIYELRKVDHPDYPPGEFRPATIADLDLASEWIGSFHEEIFGSPRADESAKLARNTLESGALFFWAAAGPVSMAARTRPTPHGESISLVYTPPRHRRRGYATAVVAKLSQMLLNEGRSFCALYTDAKNPTSDRVYRSVGYVPVGEVVNIHFDD